jgi:hypothetical protein
MRSHITVIVYIMLRIVDTPLLWATYFVSCAKILHTILNEEYECHFYGTSSESEAWLSFRFCVPSSAYTYYKQFL